MSTLLVTPTLLDQIGGEPTLDDVLVSAWEGLAVGRAVECPVCRGDLVPDYGVRARTIAGRCSACGATLR